MGFMDGFLRKKTSGNTAKDRLKPVSYTHLDVYKRQVVKGALKGAVFAANIYEKLGFKVIRCV